MPKIYKNKTANTEGYIADQTIFYCESCKKCWEITDMGSHRNPSVGYLFYEDFPSYKKQRKNCGGCDGKILQHSIRLGMDFYKILES